MTVEATAPRDPRATWSQLAAGWKKHDALHVRHTAGVSERMVAGLVPGQRVLDIACGTGDPTLAAAERVGPRGTVLGIDIVEEMLDYGRAKAAARRMTQVGFSCQDGEALPYPAASFDRVTIRWGLMYMADPAACLADAHRVLAPGGSLALACWAAVADNPWATILPAALKRHVELPPPRPGAPGPFSLADPERLCALVAAAGFSEITNEAVGLPMSDFARGADFVSYRLDTAGPLSAIIMALPAPVRDAVLAEAAVDAERRGGGQAHLRGLTWVTTARR